MTIKSILVLNAGSSSIKFALYTLDPLLKKSMQGCVLNMNDKPKIKVLDSQGTVLIEQQYSEKHDYRFFFQLLLERITASEHQLIAVGHRVVHGGQSQFEPIIISKALIVELKKLIPFVPLHQPYNIEAIEVFHEHFPDLTQVACFDTAFHHTHPAVADRFAIPRYLSDCGVKRYGFHGISYEYIMYKLNQIAPETINQRIVIAHLGNGASMCAVKDGKSIDSTMGFSALDGLMMGTRCGSLDPGVLLYLMQSKNMSHDEIEKMLYQASGLLGVSEISSDMQDLVNSDDSRAKEAIELFTYRMRYEFGAMISIMNGVDQIIFTGGIGENATTIRAAVCRELDWAGVDLDESANQSNKPVISQSSSKVMTRVIPTDEEWIIAKHTLSLLNSQ